jgi:hypothetical protein
MSTIKNTYNNIEDIPAGMETLFTEQDGVHTLTGVEGVVDKSRLNEFRENNIQLRKDIEAREEAVAQSGAEMKAITEQMEAMKNQFAGVDLEEWKAIQIERKDVEEKRLIEAGEVDQLINSRVNDVLAAQQKELAAQKSAYEKQILGLQDDVVGYNGQLNTMLVDNELAKIAGSQGVRASAVEDLLSRGRSIFRVEEGMATAFNAEGRPMYDADAVTPLTIGKWIEGLTATAPHLFEMSTGAASVQAADTAPVIEATATPHDAILAGLAGMNKK